MREEEIKEIILYGAGVRGVYFLKHLLCTDIEHIYIVDSDSRKWGKLLEGHEIFSPEIFMRKKEIPFYITIANKDKREEIRCSLKKGFQCEEMHEIGYQELMRYIFRNHKEVKRQITDIQYTRREKSYIFDCYAGLVLGGIETWTMDVCSHLCELYGSNIRILSKKGDYYINNEIKPLVDNLNIDISRDRVEQGINVILPYLLQKLPCTVVTSQPDIVLTMSGVIKKYCGDLIKIISVIHGGMEEVYKQYDVYKEDIDLYVGVSKDIQKDLITRGVDFKRVYSMTCPFHCEKKLSRGYTKDKTMPLRIGYAGRLEYTQKRMDLLLECVKNLVEREVNFKLELAGEGIAKLEMESLVTQNNLGNYVEFLGKLDRKEISAFWRRQDVCVNLSDYEGRSISVIEAMGNGVIPVVTNTSGTKEDIIEDVNGFVVPVGSCSVAVDKIEYLAQHRERLGEMGKLAHDMVYPKSLMEPHVIFWKNLLENRWF